LEVAQDFPDVAGHAAFTRIREMIINDNFHDSSATENGKSMGQWLRCQLWATGEFIRRRWNTPVWSISIKYVAMS
jgi:hypothetical protein